MIIKAGTYRFNDVMTDKEFSQQIAIRFSLSSDLPNGEYGTMYCEYIDAFYDDMFYEIEGADFDLALIGLAVGSKLTVYHADFNGWNPFLGDVLKTITILEDTEVSAEFYEWFTANAVEQKQISGKWRWNDVLTEPSVWNYISETAVPLSDFVSFYSNGKDYVLLGLSRINSVSVPGFVLQYSSSGDITEPGDAVYCDGDAMELNFGFAGWADEAYQTIDYGTTPQWVSVDYYDYVIANAKPVTDEGEDEPTPIASIHYNGATIASLFGGQTATVKLKGDGVQVVPDIVFEVAENVGGGSNDANIVPLLVGESGTYDANAPVIVTETFTGGGTPDAMLFGDYPCFKAKKLVATKDIFTLAYNEDLANRLYVTAMGDTVPLCEMNKHKSSSCLTMSIEGFYIPVVMWVVQTDDIGLTADNGFEDGAVYVLDIWSLLGATGEATVTALGTPDKPADGFMPVEVGIPLTDLEVTPEYQVERVYQDSYYRKVTIKPPPSTALTVKPSLKEQVFYYYQDQNGNMLPLADRKAYLQVTVEAFDMTQSRVLCDIELQTLPKTEYVYGEWLSTNGGVILLHYTDGSKLRVNLTNSDIAGFVEAQYTPGKHTLRVIYTENGITCRTFYDITVVKGDTDFSLYINFVAGRGEKLCTADSGMTWAEWVVSRYNIYSCYIRDDNVFYNSYGNELIVQNNGVPVLTTDAIIADITYTCDVATE